MIAVMTLRLEVTENNTCTVWFVQSKPPNVITL